MQYLTWLKTDFGTFGIAGDDEFISELIFDFTPEPPAQPYKEIDNANLQLAIKELKAYFQGKLQQFTCRIRPQGTPFQEAVWKATATIPYGKYVYYSDIAIAVGKPLSARAVGTALNKTPIPIIIPCHRVVGKGGITGYAGGPDMRRRLLILEGADV
ncbi:MAG: methylated-DNA--[protein]-cysteine S-methyltransferase [Candidatus Cloacimonetes bacterium]|nr:methylated-DNA--[protein]-cysteine S-methyltransferase [Candidatus Cloacimonadota bacterium]